MTVSRRGQILGQVVAMIMAIIVFSLVLLYGYNAIKSIERTRQQVEIIEFSESLKSAVKRISLDFGSVKRIDLKVPAAYKEVCFIDLEVMGGSDTVKKLNELEKKSALIADAVRSNIKAADAQNVFTIPAAETPLRVEKLEVNRTQTCPGSPPEKSTGSGFMCVPTPTGKLSLRLEGLGDRTFVCQWK